MKKKGVYNLRLSLECEPEYLVGVRHGGAAGGGAEVIHRAFALGVQLDGAAWEVGGNVIERCCKRNHLDLEIIIIIYLALFLYGSVRHLKSRRDDR